LGTEVTFQFKVKNSSFANNIFYGEASAAECYENTGTGHTGNVWGKNLWWGAGMSSAGLPGTTVIADPKYVAPASGNLRIHRSSPAIGAGAVAADITTWTSAFWDKYFPPNGAIPPNGKVDINGEARIESTIDLGADEYGTASGVTTTQGVTADLMSF